VAINSQKGSSLQPISLKVFDETLRDGEQQAGLFFPYETKVELAQLIASTGVDYIDIMPMIDDSEERLVRSLVQDGMGDLITPAVMTGKRFVDHAKACGVKRIILFHAVSDRLMFFRDAEARRSELFKNKPFDDAIPNGVIERIRHRVKEQILECLRYATSPEVGLEVDFAAEDASRADFQFLVECIREFRPYLSYFMLCDTVGMLNPERAYGWVQELREATDSAPLAVHFHNDLGMALENTIQGVLGGAEMISGTFGGIGERAGNAALDQVLHGVRVRFGVEVEGIDYDNVERVAAYLREIGAVAAAPYSPAASRHETGIHVNSLLRDWRSYSIFPFEDPEIWFGKCSGASNFQYLFEKQLDTKLSTAEYQRMRAKIKALSISEGRCFSCQQVKDLYERGFFDQNSDDQERGLHDSNAPVPPGRREQSIGLSDMDSRSTDQQGAQFEMRTASLDE